MGRNEWLARWKRALREQPHRRAAMSAWHEEGAMATLRTERGGRLWLGLLAGPVAWGANHLVVYNLAQWAREGGPSAPMHLSCAVFLAVAICGGRVAWRNWKEGGGWPSPHVAGPD